MIQKNVVFFWGNSTLSWLRYMTLCSFRKLNPDWKMTLYVCSPSVVNNKTWRSIEDQDFFTFSGKDYFEDVKKLDIGIESWEFSDPSGVLTSDSLGPSHKSNFFKWMVLSKYSGFYSDLDILYTKPIKKYYETVKDFDLVICWNGRYFSIGFLGSSGNNKFYQDVYSNTFKSFGIKAYQSAGVRSVYSLLNQLVSPGSKSFKTKSDMWDRIKRFYPQIKSHINSMNFVYPWTAMKMQNVFERNHITLPEDCYGIHWYAGNPLSQKYNNLMNGDNFKKYDNTFANFAGKIL